MIDFTRFRFYLSSLIFLKLFDFFCFRRLWRWVEHGMRCVEQNRKENLKRRQFIKRSQSLLVGRPKPKHLRNTQGTCRSTATINSKHSSRCTSKNKCCDNENCACNKNGVTKKEKSSKREANLKTFPSKKETKRKTPT